jgi:CRP-like cAMP-binding protein
VKRTASVRALSPVLVDTLGKDAFLRELERLPQLRERMEHTVAQRSAAPAPA